MSESSVQQKTIYPSEYKDPHPPDGDIFIANDYCKISLTDTRREITALCPENRFDSIKLKNASLVFGIFSEEMVQDYDSNKVVINTAEVFGEKYQLCYSERFWSQPSAALGTAFILSDTLVVTAKHCIKDTKIENLYLLYGFDVVHEVNLIRNVIPENDVYRVKRVLYMGKEDEDFVILVLKNAVNHTYVLQTDINVSDNDVLHCIGYPMGLPLKVISNALVMENLDDCCFTASLDAYQGNSGSPVFDSYTGEVVGMLIQGMQDFVYTGSCYKTNVCRGEECMGERIIRINIILEALRLLLD